jgi:hypothetical protein
MAKRTKAPIFAKQSLINLLIFPNREIKNALPKGIITNKGKILLDIITNL